MSGEIRVKGLGVLEFLIETIHVVDDDTDAASNVGRVAIRIFQEVDAEAVAIDNGVRRQRITLRHKGNIESETVFEIRRCAGHILYGQHRRDRFERCVHGKVHPYAKRPPSLYSASRSSTCVRVTP